MKKHFYVGQKVSIEIIQETGGHIFPIGVNGIIRVCDYSTNTAVVSFYFQGETCRLKVPFSNLQIPEEK